MRIFGIISNAFIKSKYEPEFDEIVQHDTTMEIVNGELMEVDSSDFEIRK